MTFFAPAATPSGYGWMDRRTPTLTCIFAILATNLSHLSSAQLNSSVLLIVSLPNFRMKIINHKVASENNNDNLVNEDVAKDQIKENVPNLVSEVVATNTISMMTGWSNY